jgi:hypothetical protein
VGRTLKKKGDLPTASAAALFPPLYSQGISHITHSTIGSSLISVEVAEKREKKKKRID